jgi:hypothetical protein
MRFSVGQYHYTLIFIEIMDDEDCGRILHPRFHPFREHVAPKRRYREASRDRVASLFLILVSPTSAWVIEQTTAVQCGGPVHDRDGAGFAMLHLEGLILSTYLKTPPLSTRNTFLPLPTYRIVLWFPLPVSVSITVLHPPTLTLVALLEVRLPAPSRPSGMEEGVFKYSKYMLRPGKAFTDCAEKSRLHRFVKYIIGCFRPFSLFGVSESGTGLNSCHSK